MGAIYLNGISYAGGGGGGGSSDYSQLTHKPEINGATLTENTTTSDLGLVDGSTLEVDNNDKIKIKNLPSLDGDILVLTFT